MHYGQISQFRDSQFLDAIDADLIRLEGMNLEKQKNDARYARDYQQTAVYKEKKARLQSRTVNDIHSGDKVQHNVFGDGVVVTVLNEQCTIAFAKPYGIKTLMKDHPALSKV
jgi:DNA helicase-2/ATP-dependent DNA helicase PcrA